MNTSSASSTAVLGLDVLRVFEDELRAHLERAIWPYFHAELELVARTGSLEHAMMPDRSPLNVSRNLFKGSPFIPSALSGDGGAGARAEEHDYDDENELQTHRIARIQSEPALLHTGKNPAHRQPPEPSEGDYSNGLGSSEKEKEAEKEKERESDSRLGSALFPGINGTSNNYGASESQPPQGGDSDGGGDLAGPVSPVPVIRRGLASAITDKDGGGSELRPLPAEKVGRAKVDMTNVRFAKKNQTGATSAAAAATKISWQEPRSGVDAGAEEFELGSDARSPMAERQSGTSASASTRARRQNSSFTADINSYPLSAIGGSPSFCDLSSNALLNGAGSGGNNAGVGVGLGVGDNAGVGGNLSQNTSRGGFGTRLLSDSTPPRPRFCKWDMDRRRKVYADIAASLSRQYAALIVHTNTEQQKLSFQLLESEARMHAYAVFKDAAKSDPGIRTLLGLSEVARGDAVGLEPHDMVPSGRLEFEEEAKIIRAAWILDNPEYSEDDGSSLATGRTTSVSSRSLVLAVLRNRMHQVSVQTPATAADHASGTHGAGGVGAKNHSEFRDRLVRLFPVLDWSSWYGSSPQNFIGDLFAGLTVGIMLIPQGMAYARLAGLPPQYGLYGGGGPLMG